MILKKNTDLITLPEPIGDVINATINRDGILYPLIRVAPETILEAQKRFDGVGFPTQFSFVQLSLDKTDFLFFPKADKDYDISIAYFPPLRKA